MAHDLEKMRREIAEHKAERVARGLPADLPPRLVEDEHTLRIYNDSRPLYTFLVEYSLLLAKAGQVVPYDIEPYNKYIRMLEVMSKSKDRIFGAYGAALKGGLSAIKEMNDGELPYERAVRGIYTCISLAAIATPHSIRVKAYEGDDFDDILADYEKRIAEQKAEEERLEREFMERKAKGND